MAAKLLELSRNQKASSKPAGNNDEFGKRDSQEYAQSSKTIEALLAEEDKVVVATAHWLIDGKPFQTAVYGTILVNSIQMGVAVDNPDWEGWIIFENLFTVLFLLEMIAKLYFMGKTWYFSDGWNRMDCFLVCMSMLDNWIVAPIQQGSGSAMSQLSVLRVLRILRVARMARLLKVFKELFVILMGILESLRTMFWVSLLLLLTLYVCSILCVDIMGRGPDEDGNLVYEGYDDNPDNIDAQKAVAAWNNYVYFGTMIRSMYTLFNIVILAEFPEIGRPMVEKQPGMIFFFVIFIVFTTFGVLNVIIGVIVDNTMEAAKGMEREMDDKEKKQKIALLGRIRDMVFALDKDDSGSISVEEIEEGWQEPQLRDLLRDINLPKGFTPEELMSLLDADGDGELTFEEFMRSFYRLIASDTFQQSCCMHASLNEVKAKVNDVKKHQEEATGELKEQILELESKMDSRLANIESMMKKLLGIPSTSGGNSNNSRPSSKKGQAVPNNARPTSPTEERRDSTGSFERRAQSAPTKVRPPVNGTAGYTASGDNRAQNGAPVKYNTVVHPAGEANGHQGPRWPPDTHAQSPPKPPRLPSPNSIPRPASPSRDRLGLQAFPASKDRILEC